MAHRFAAPFYCAVFAAVSAVAAGAATVERLGINNAVDGVAASVNGKGITVSEVVSYMRMDPADEASGADRETVFRRMYERALDEAIDRELIVEEYESGDLRVPEHMLDRRVADIVERNFGGDRSKLMDMLSAARMKYDDWRENIRKQLIVMAMERSFVYDNVHVSVGDVLSEYRKNSDLYTQKAEAEVSLIALNGTNNLDVVAQGIASGSDFAELARRYSVGSNAEDGGKMGRLVPSEDLNPVIAEALEGISAGETAGPVEIGGMNYFVRKDSETLAGRISLAEVQDKIRESIFEREAERLRSEWIRKLRGNASIVIYPPYE